jgi:hypothetical protein
MQKIYVSDFEIGQLKLSLGQELAACTVKNLAWIRGCSEERTDQIISKYFDTEKVSEITYNFLYETDYMFL